MRPGKGGILRVGRLGSGRRPNHSDFLSAGGHPAFWTLRKNDLNCHRQSPWTELGLRPR